jgi:hypothetical protein
VKSRLVWFPDENHWILKPRNSKLWYGEFFGWLKSNDPGPGKATAKAQAAPAGAKRAAKDAAKDAVKSAAKSAAKAIAKAAKSVKG